MADQGSAPSVVRATAPAASAAYQLEWAREWVRDRFWVIPSALLVLGTALAVATVEAAHLGIPHGWRSGFAADPGKASGFLGIIASATLTFLGVVFTLTLVALQLASSQLSPRVLRTFVRSGVTKAAFGILLATFSYSVTVLVISGGRNGEADSRAVTVAMLLVAASLIIFVWYVSATMELLQVVSVIAAVASQTRAAISDRCPPASVYRPAAAPVLLASAAVIRLPVGQGRRGRGVRGAPGRILGIDDGRLVMLARRYDCVLELTVRVGEFVPGGGPIALAHGGTVPAPAVVAGINFGRGRTLYQDPAYGMRQLADIAVQALSPAVNQPTTAVLVIDSLEDILLRIARRPAATGLFADHHGIVRLIEPAMTWDGYLDLAFTEITTYGASSPQIARRLLAAYAVLETATGPAARPGLAARRDELARLAAASGIGPATLRADPMGLG
ncbi:MAG TPA: DUF2254 domain-containing protein [Streptosporangiaceae bacterium]